MMRINVKGDDRLRKMFSNASRKIEKSVENEFMRIALDYRNNVMEAMKTTPKNRSRGQIRQNKGKNSKYHYPSFRGNPPAIDTGNLINSIQVQKITYGAQVYVWGAPYSEDLEDKEKLNRPVWQPELEKMNVTQRILKQIDRSLN